jgi:hypothetical protein
MSGEAGVAWLKAANVGESGGGAMTAKKKKKTWPASENRSEKLGQYPQKINIIGLAESM